MGQLGRPGSGCKGSVQVDLVRSSELTWHGVGFGVVVTANTEMNLSGHPLPTRTIVTFRRPSLLLAA
jgi:hypothetical protein